MKFALVYSYDPSEAGPSEAEISDWIAFDQAVKDAGVFVSEAGFHQPEEAQTVMVRDGNITTKQAAVAITGNVVAGFYVIEVASIDQAITWAQQIPTAAYGQIEVRQVVEF